MYSLSMLVNSSIEIYSNLYNNTFNSLVSQKNFARWIIWGTSFLWYKSGNESFCKNRYLLGPYIVIRSIWINKWFFIIFNVAITLFDILFTSFVSGDVPIYQLFTRLSKQSMIDDKYILSAAIWNSVISVNNFKFGSSTCNISWLYFQQLAIFPQNTNCTFFIW